MTRTFTSGHAELLDAYLTFKRSLGYTLSNPYHWMDIDRFLQASGTSGSGPGISEPQFKAWYERRPNATKDHGYISF